jgi:archaetidylinositol phosphate synthase
VDVTAAAKPRPRSEVLLRLLRPLTDALVGVLGRWGVDPLAIVVTHATLGLLAAAAIALGPTGWWWAAGLLLVKMLLDNLDGGVARATGRVTRMGRYLDSVLDLAVNIALFAALALHGPSGWAWPLAVAAALTLMLVLSLDFNMEQRYKALRSDAAGPESDDPIGAPLPLYLSVKGVYDAVLAPQDRSIARLDDALFATLAGHERAAAPLDVRLAWSDLFSTASLVNLGLSTQLLVLGVCLVVGQPFAYVWFVLACGAYALALQAVRALRLHRYLGARA